MEKPGFVGDGVEGENSKRDGWNWGHLGLGCKPSAMKTSWNI